MDPDQDVHKEVLRSVRQCAAAAGNALRFSICPYRVPEAFERCQNQFITMLKPEVLDVQSGVDVIGVLQLIAERMRAFGIQRHAVVVLSAGELTRDGLLEKHYGILNRVSRLGLSALAPSAERRLRELMRSWGQEDGSVLGAFEFLHRNPDFTPRSVETLCRNVETIKLGAGAYAIFVRCDGEAIVILNAFHPRQMAHFYAPGNAFVIMECRSERRLCDIRQFFIGETDPQDAAIGTVKHALLERAQDLGVRGVTIGFNGFHVSPGPVEGMLAMIRYFTNDEGRGLRPEDTALGSLLLDSGWSSETIMALDERLAVNAGGDLAPVLEITEDMNWDEALSFLNKQ